MPARIFYFESVVLTCPPYPTPNFSFFSAIILTTSLLFPEIFWRKFRLSFCPMTGGFEGGLPPCILKSAHCAILNRPSGSGPILSTRETLFIPCLLTNHDISSILLLLVMRKSRISQLCAKICTHSWYLILIIGICLSRHSEFCPNGLGRFSLSLPSPKRNRHQF